MKNNKYTSVLAIASMVALGACSDIDDIVPEGGTMLETQLKATISIIPGRADATFSGSTPNLETPFLSVGSHPNVRMISDS